MNLHRIEIPFGIATKGEVVSIPIILPHRNHCFISGASGSGKSTTLKIIIDAIGRNYDKAQTVVWTDYYSHNYERSHGASIVEVTVSEMRTEERTAALLDRLYEEAQNRLQIISRNGMSSYSQLDELPLLIAVIDDFFPLDYSNRSRRAADNLWKILSMSHVVGISLICSCQLPLSRLEGIPSSVEDFFNVRILRCNSPSNGRF